MKRNLVKYIYWILVGILVLGVAGYILVYSFPIFAKPETRLIAHKCDHDGLRSAKIYREDGDAVTNESMHVSIDLGCDNEKDGKIIFSADNITGRDSDIHISWQSFDTLAVKYWKGLRVFSQLKKVEFKDTHAECVC